MCFGPTCPGRCSHPENWRSEHDQHKSKQDAMTREIQSWLKYHAVKAAPRSQFVGTDVVEMRWILRFKDSGQAKARLVIIRYNDPRIGGEVRTEALVLSRRGRSFFLTKEAQNRFKLRNGDVKHAFLQGQGTGQDVLLVAESVAELAEHPHLTKEQSGRGDKVLIGTDRRSETMVADVAA